MRTFFFFFIYIYIRLITQTNNIKIQTVDLNNIEALQGCWGRGIRAPLLPEKNANISFSSRKKIFVLPKLLSSPLSVKIKTVDLYNIEALSGCSGRGIGAPLLPEKMPTSHLAPVKKSSCSLKLLSSPLAVKQNIAVTIFCKVYVRA